LTTSCNVKLQN